jgi:hypothetical protein
MNSTNKVELGVTKTVGDFLKIRIGGKFLQKLGRIKLKPKTATRAKALIS